MPDVETRRKIAELRAHYSTLVDEIASVEMALIDAIDPKHKRAHLAELTRERDRVAFELSKIETAAGQSEAGGHRRQHIVDDNELWRMIGEMRGDMKVLEKRIDEVCRQNEREAVSGFPTPLLYMILVIGVTLIILMAFISVRIGLTGWTPLLPIWQAFF